MTREEKVRYILSMEAALNLMGEAQGLIIMNDPQDAPLLLLEELNKVKELASRSLEKAIDDLFPRSQVVYSVIISDFESVKCHSSWTCEEDAQLVADLYQLKDDEQSVTVEEMKVYGALI